MSTTIPALSSVDDILDSDLVMITHSNGESFKIAGSEINKRNQAVIASGTTITGAPLKTGNIVRVYFTADITGSNTSTGLTLNYNGVKKSVKVPKNGTLANFVASDLGGSPTVYKYLQAHTTLELLYDGTQFIIIGNPVVLSSSDYTIYADGLKRVDAVASGDKNMVTSSAVANVIESINENLFPVRIFFYEVFNIAQGSSDYDIWWRVFEGTATNEQYSYMYIEITVINIAYTYAPPNVTKYIVSPQIGSDPSPSVLQLYKTNTSCHGCRVGKDSNNHWFVDLHLRANIYHIFTQGIGYKRSEKQSKVTMDNFTFVSAVGD